MFTHNVVIRLHDTDAAGVLYFANQLRIAHEGFEEFLASAGFPIGKMLGGSTHLPIVHAEADFIAPVFAGDEITVEITSDRIGESSFTMLYRFVKNGNIAVGSARTVHASIDAKTRKKCSLDEGLREALQKIS